jgi:hypothetical protein
MMAKPPLAVVVAPRIGRAGTRTSYCAGVGVEATNELGSHLAPRCPRAARTLCAAGLTRGRGARSFGGG